MVRVAFAPSLNLKLVLAFAGVVFVAVALASVLMNRLTTNEFQSYVIDRQAMQQHMGGAPSSTQGMMDSGSMMGQSENSFLADMRRSLGIAGAVTVAVALGLAAVMARQITRPLRRLAAATADIAGGKLDTRIERPGSDEVGQLGRAFNDMTAALQRQEEVRQSMMADIAHELRNPLFVLRGNLEAIQDGLLEPTPQQVAVLHDQSLALSRLVDDLRTLSLASAGHLELRLRAADLGELAQSVASELEAVAREREVSLTVKADRELPPVTVDRDRIGQALRNLLDNALRYTPRNGRIDVGVSRQNRDAIVSVADTGSGIAPQDLPHVFDRFYRADGSRSRATGGSGLGLAIVKQLVEAHGGRVWAESVPDKGSVFAFSLPIE